MNFKDKVIVPPNCPALIDTSKPKDLSTAKLDLMTHDCEDDGSGNSTVTESWVTFTEPGAEEAFVAPESLVVPIDSDISNQLRDLANRIDEGDEANRDNLQRILCSRVLNCHGVVDGECWALGASALSRIVSTIMNDPA